MVTICPIMITKHVHQALNHASQGPCTPLKRHIHTRLKDLGECIWNIYIYMCVCVCVCIYVCIYIYSHLWLDSCAVQHTAGAEVRRCHLTHSYVWCDWMTHSHDLKNTFDMSHTQSKTPPEPRRYCDYFHCLCPTSLWVSTCICATIFVCVSVSVSMSVLLSFVCVCLWVRRCTCHVARVNDSWHTYGWVMSHIWMSHVALVSMSQVTHMKAHMCKRSHVYSNMRTRTHVNAFTSARRTHTNESYCIWE